MSELPEGWTLDVERQPNGINTHELRRSVPGVSGLHVVVRAVTYPHGGAWVEHESLETFYNDCGEYHANNETMDVADLRGRALLFAQVADDLEERDRTTSRDVLVYVHDSRERLYAFECDQRAAVGDVVAIFGREEAQVIELGTGGWDGPRKPAKFVRRAVVE